MSEVTELPAAFAVLAALGRAFAVEWHGGPYKGAWYQVTGRRGNARKVYGLVGECTWVGQGEYSRFRRSVSTTTRVGLKAAGADKPVYVPASCVTRVTPPAEALPIIAAREAAAAAKAALPRCAAARGDVLKVVRGKHEGRVGRVFWVGAGKGGVPRYGLDEHLARKRGRCESPLWVDATEVERYVAPSAKVVADLAAKPSPVFSTAAPAAVEAPTPVPPAAAAAAPAPATPTCTGKHKAGDGSYWVADARGIPVARACDRCRAAKVAAIAATAKEAA